MLSNRAFAVSKFSIETATRAAYSLAVLVSRVRSDAVRAFVGLLFGVALYLVNFLVISPITFAVFQDANQPLELATHIIFGSVAVLFLLGRRAHPTA